eukprot:TRINITY_DN7139_c0_g1_i1.p1 TRINITY_DN7139_c0_g1~~TRINITY_DN7139_c0_g1_i1.p1  ORF type:complete len:437 (+),score=185.10 TRINITY_DN7139_c0_g1_i1:112-1311(+)
MAQPDPSMLLGELHEEYTKYTKEIAMKKLQDRGLTTGSLAQRLCVHLLMRGCLHSFTELYHLSHRPPVCVDELAAQMFSVPDDDLPMIADVLAEAEESRRESKFREVYDKYHELADFFEASGDREAAIHFHLLGLRCARASGDQELEGIAHEKQGHAHERLGDLDKAVVCHETFLRLAEASRNMQRKRDANDNLIRVYMAQATRLEEEGEYEKARDFFEKAVHTANSNNDQDAEAEAYNRIGRINTLLGDLSRALEYQKRFLLVSKQLKHAGKEGRAARECAALQAKLEQHNDASQSLLRALEIAEEQEDLHGIASSCRQLGHLYNSVGDYAKARHYFKDFFRVAQTLRDAAMIEEARIKLGLAEGNLQWHTAGGGGFVGMVARDLPAILKWKSTGSLT